MDAVGKVTSSGLLQKIELANDAAILPGVIELWTVGVLL
jgi:hypothetical protein